MTDEELQRFTDENVRISCGGQVLTGKLVAGFAAQVRIQAPYAIEWYDLNPSFGTNEQRLTAIPNAEVVETIELVNKREETKTDIEDAAEDAQTPG